MTDTVAIVFDPDFADALRALNDTDVWVIRSPKNSAVVDDLRQAGHTHLTTFEDYMEPDVEAFDEILRTIELHHGEYGQDSPFRRAVVYGLAFDDAFRERLSSLGFGFVGRTPNGFTVRR